MDKSKMGSVSCDCSEAVKSAPKSSPKLAKGKGMAMEKVSSEKASMAPKHKGAKPSHEGVPSKDPVSMGLPMESSKLHLDGHPLKK